MRSVPCAGRGFAARIARVHRYETGLRLRGLVSRAFVWSKFERRIAPGAKLPDCLGVGLPSVPVADVGGEKLDESPDGRFSGTRKHRRDDMNPARESLPLEIGTADWFNWLGEND